MLCNEALLKIETFKNYDNCFLGAKDLIKSKAFYSKGLGLETKFDFSEME